MTNMTAIEDFQSYSTRIKIMINNEDEVTCNTGSPNFCAILSIPHSI